MAVELEGIYGHAVLQTHAAKLNNFLLLALTFAMNGTVVPDSQERPAEFLPSAGIQFIRQNQSKPGAKRNASAGEESNLRNSE